MQTKSLTAIYWATVFASLTLCGLCLALPVYQWLSIAQTPAVKVAAASAALAVGICKLVFFPLSAECLKHKRILPSVVLFILAVLSLWLSVNATRDLLQNVESNRQQTQTEKTADYQLALNALNDINEEIKTVNALVRADASSQYRGRAYTNLPKLENLRSQRSEIETKIQTRAVVNSAGQHWTFGKNIDLTLGAQTWRLSAATISAASLHLLCVFSLLAITSWWPVPAPFKPQTQTEETHNKTLNTKTQKETSGMEKTQTKKAAKETSKPKTPTKLSDDQTRIYNLIEAGAYGDQVALRHVVQDKNIKGGYPVVRPVFDKLLADKKIVRVKRGYELVKKHLVKIHNTYFEKDD